MNLEICLAQKNRDFISQMAKALEKGLYPRPEDSGFYTLYYNENAIGCRTLNLGGLGTLKMGGIFVESNTLSFLD